MDASGKGDGSRRRSREDFESGYPKKEDFESDDDEFRKFKYQKTGSGLDEKKSPPTTPSTIHSPHTRPSPSSVSKPSFKYEAVDANGSQSLSGNFNGKEDRIEQGSMALMVAEHRSELSKTGIIYETIQGHKERIENRLKELCSLSFEACEDKIESAVLKPRMNAANEITDAASLLKLVRSQKQALSAAMLLLEAENLLNHSLQLLL